MLNIHPRSINFDWDACTIRPAISQRITDIQWQQFIADGYFVIDDLLTPEQVRQITVETDRGYDEANEFSTLRGMLSFAPFLSSPVCPETK